MLNSKATSINIGSKGNFQTAKSSTLLLFEIYNVKLVDLFLCGKLFFGYCEILLWFNLSLGYFLHDFKIIFSTA